MRSSCSTPSHSSGCSGPACSNFQFQVLIILCQVGEPDKMIANDDLNTATSPLVASLISWAASSPLSRLRQRSKTWAPLLQQELLIISFSSIKISIPTTITFTFYLLRSSAEYFPMPVFAPVIATKQPSNLVLLRNCLS